MVTFGDSHGHPRATRSPRLAELVTDGRTTAEVGQVATLALGPYPSGKCDTPRANATWAGAGCRKPDERGGYVVFASKDEHDWAPCWLARESPVPGPGGCLSQVRPPPIYTAPLQVLDRGRARAESSNQRFVWSRTPVVPSCVLTQLTGSTVPELHSCSLPQSMKTAEGVRAYFSHTRLELVFWGLIKSNWSRNSKKGE